MSSTAAGLRARSVGRFLGRAVLAVALVWALTLGGIVAGAWVLSRQTALPAPADAIVCLGAGMSRTAGWDQPDAASARRARTCAALHASGVAPVVIFTGYGHEVQSAAGAMYEVAVAAGLPRDAGLVEPRALSTIQNADFSLDLMPEAQRLVLVSDGFHLPRSWLIFRIFGVADVSVHATDAGFGAPVTDRTERGMVEWILRESAAIWFNALRGLLYLGGGWVGIDHDTRIGWFN